MRPLVRFLAAVPLTVLLLSGCTPADPPVTPRPAPSSTPAFASDEEALAAATKAYAAYLAMSDTIGADGGANPQRIAPLVSKAQLKKELEGFGPLRENRYHTSGSSAFDTSSLELYRETTKGAEAVLYLCLDSSAVRVMDSSGTDVTPLDRISRRPFEIGFAQSMESRTLVLERSDLWDGEDFC